MAAAPGAGAGATSDGAAGKPMARKSQHTLAKRQREQRRAEKVAQKQARRVERTDLETQPVDPGVDPAPIVNQDATDR